MILPHSVFTGIDRFCRLVVDPVREHVFSPAKDPEGEGLFGKAALGLPQDEPAVWVRRPLGDGEALEAGGENPVGGMVPIRFSGRPRLGKTGIFWKVIQDPELNKESEGGIVIVDFKGLVGMVWWRVFHRGGSL